MRRPVTTTRRALRSLGLGLAAIGSAAALASCSAGSADVSAGSSTGEKPTVVASTSVYGSLASAVAGDNATVSSIISSPSQDPHSYEASARDKLTLSRANIVILNGGGYDDFAVQIVDSLSAKPTIVQALDEHEGEHDHAAHDESGHDEATHGEDAHAGHDHGGVNEHVWYDVDEMKHVVISIEESLSAADPQHASDYSSRAATLQKQLDGLIQRVEALKSDAKGKNYLMTEPVPQALLEEAGLSNATPDGLAEAIEEGDEITPLTLNKAKDALKSKEVSVFAYNSQTADGQTESLRQAAVDAGVPVLDVTETLPEGQDYVQWMGQNIDHLKEALNAGK